MCVLSDCTNFNLKSHAGLGREGGYRQAVQFLETAASGRGAGDKELGGMEYRNTARAKYSCMREGRCAATLLLLHCTCLT